jgi:hypothetical protein
VLQVLACVVQGQGLHAAGRQDALPQLFHARLTDEGMQGVLADQKDLQQGPRPPLKVRDHPQLLQRLVRQVLRLIDDEEGVVPRVHLPRQHRLEVQQGGCLGAVVGVDVEGVGHEAEQVVGGHLGARDAGDPDVRRARVRQQVLDQGRLAGAGLARDHDEPFSLVQGVLHVCLGPGEVAVPVTESWVRAQAEGVEGQSIEFVEHVWLASVCLVAWGQLPA